MKSKDYFWVSVNKYGVQNCGILRGETLVDAIVDSLQASYEAFNYCLNDFSDKDPSAIKYRELKAIAKKIEKAVRNSEVDGSSRCQIAVFTIDHYEMKPLWNLTKERG
jgi:hypothetical protein